MKPKEIWKPIIGYESLYRISDRGRVLTLTRDWGKNKYLKTSMVWTGYKMIHLSDYGKKSFSLHRLLAKHFIPNPENKPHVNHKNGIKTDNRLCNLEWVTKSENGLHAYKNGLMKGRYRRINKIDSVTNLVVGDYENIHVAAKANFVKHPSVRRWIWGVYKAPGGYIWKYAPYKKAI